MGFERDGDVTSSQPLRRACAVCGLDTHARARAAAGTSGGHLVGLPRKQRLAKRRRPTLSLRREWGRLDTSEPSLQGSPSARVHTCAHTHGEASASEIRFLMFAMLPRR